MLLLLTMMRTTKHVSTVAGQYFDEFGYDDGNAANDDDDHDFVVNEDDDEDNFPGGNCWQLRNHTGATFAFRCRCNNNNDKQSQQQK